MMPFPGQGLISYHLSFTSFAYKLHYSRMSLSLSQPWFVYSHPVDLTLSLLIGSYPDSPDSHRAARRFSCLSLGFDDVCHTVYELLYRYKFPTSFNQTPLTLTLNY